MKLKIKNKECKIENKLSNFRNVILNLFQDLKSIEFSKNTKNKMLKQADLRTAFTPVSENIELTEPIRLENEIIRARSKSKTVQHDMKKAAFTLAEVLITLGIIGVVAAITMPTLIANYQKHATVNQLKKAYSEIGQVIQKAEVENGSMYEWYMPASNFDNSLEQSKYFGDNYIFPNMKTVEKCMPTSNKCWADDIVNINGQQIAGPHMTNLSDSNVSFITNSGYSVLYWLHSNGTGALFVVDLNGHKKRPNKIGRDIFAFSLQWKPYPNLANSRTGYFPAGLGFTGVTKEDLMNTTYSGQGVYYACKKADSTNALGAYCTGLIAIDGWQIKDDYPW